MTAASPTIAFTHTVAGAETLPNKRPRCPWVGCSASAIGRNELETKAHLDEHWSAMAEQWSPGTKCSWPSCASKAVFKSFSSLKTHTLNIHVRPLVCTAPQCSYKKPFGKMYELQRHIATAHGDGCNCKCPVEGCEASLTGFSRKDKMLKHLREQHDVLKCPYNHCSATVLKTETESHLQQFHGSFECALGSCETGLKSCFRKIGLQRHLRTHHSITNDPVQTIMSHVRKSDDKTAHGLLRTAWQDCRLCSAQHGNEVPSWNSDAVNIQTGEKSL